jgi:nucleotide-binding universal stress UspA family protein
MIDAPASFPLAKKHLPDVHPDDYQELMALKIELQQKGVDCETVFVGGNPSEEILEAAETHRAELIILGSHGHGAIYDLIMGSVTRSILYYTTTPTLVVPSPGKQPTEAVSGEFVRDYASAAERT